MWFAKKSSTTNALLIDIGSGSVGAGVVNVNSTSKSDSKIIYTARDRFDSVERADTKATTEAMLASITRILEEVRKTQIKIDQVHCFYSSPWHSSYTKIITFSKDKPFILTEKIIDTVIEREKKDKDADESLTLIDHQIFRFKVNGYRTEIPIGQNIKSFEAAVSISLSPKEVISSIEESVHRNLGQIKIEHHCFEFSAFKSMRKAQVVPKDFMLIHVHHRVTDLMVVNDGIPFEIVSFPGGDATIVRGIATASGSEESLILSKADLYQKGDLHDEEEVAFKKAIAMPFAAWLFPIQKFLTSLTTNHITVPKKIFLIANSRIEELCHEALSGSDFSQYTFAGEEFDIVNFDLDEKSAPKREVNAKADQKITLEALFVITR